MNNVKRTYAPGEEWLYYKLYCGVRTADQLLMHEIRELTENLSKDQRITHWFFIRFRDPEPHIRLRLHLQHSEETTPVMECCNRYFKSALEQERIWKMQLDTYQRELERYGSQTIEHVEQIFFRDSQFMVSALKEVVEEELYFLFVLRCVNQFIALMLPTEAGRLEFFESHRDGFLKEFEVSKPTKLSIDKKYRGMRKKIELILERNQPLVGYSALQGLLTEWNDAIKEEISYILKQQNKGTLEVSLAELTSSLVHMFVNRAFRDRQRFYEMFLYDCLYRYSLTRIKRKQAMIR